MSINYWKWSKGETYYKSPRKDVKEIKEIKEKTNTASDYGYEEGEQTTQEIT